jgi:hypothetical protein
LKAKLNQLVKMAPKKYIMHTKVSLFLIGLFSVLTATSQYIEGNINYLWNSPSRLLLSGEYKPVIVVGDSVTIELSGTVDLRPWEEEKKRGGFLGIGRKRYKVIHSDVKNVKDVQIHIGLETTNWTTVSKEIQRTVVLLASQTEETDFFNEIKNEHHFNGYIAEAGKNPILGSANVTIRVKIDTKNRMGIILNYLSKYKPESFTLIRDIIDAGNVAKQYPNELIDTLFQYFSKSQPDVLAKIKTELFEYFLLKSPSNYNVRARLAQAYIEDEKFAIAKAEAIKTIHEIGQKDPTRLEVRDRLALGIAYNSLGDVHALQELGIQANAYQVAVSFYKKAAEQFYLAGTDGLSGYRESITRQVKGLEKIGTITALKEAATLLEDIVTR